jgi:hypothetical protein
MSYLVIADLHHSGSTGIRAWSAEEGHRSYGGGRTANSGIRCRIAGVACSPKLVEVHSTGVLRRVGDFEFSS